MMNPATSPSLGMRLPQFGGAPPSAGQFTQPGAGGAPGLPAAPMSDPGAPIGMPRSSLTPGAAAPIRPFSQIGLPGFRNPTYSPTL